MADRSAYLDLIRELVKGDPDAYRQRCERLDEEGWDQLGLVVGAGFFLTVREHLGSTPDTSGVIRLVAETRAEIAGTGFDLEPKLAEELVTATLTGDAATLEDFDPHLIIESEMLFLWKLLQGLSDEEMSRFLANVDTLARKWDSGSEPE